MVTGVQTCAFRSDIPAILPTIIIMLIFNCANIVSIGLDKVFLMQNSLNASVSEVISTFVYKVGVVNSNVGFSTAAGLFQSIVSFVLLIIINKICKKITKVAGCNPPAAVKGKAHKPAADHPWQRYPKRFDKQTAVNAESEFSNSLNAT